MWAFGPGGLCAFIFLLTAGLTVALENLILLV